MIHDCLWVVKLSNHYSYRFSLILTKLGTRDLCTNMKKIVEQIITTLILNFLAYFLNFKFGQSRTAAVQLSRLANLFSLAF